jgi:hypothetical protein
MATSSPQLPQSSAVESQNRLSGQEHTTTDEIASTEEMQVNTQKPKPLLPQTKTPEPRPDQQPMNNQAQTPSTPGIYLPFNWDDFESRYEKALLDADSHERELLNEFDHLVKVCVSYPTCLWRCGFRQQAG